ncbi:MAG TPA: FecR domain-containing protein [Pyrinomonadaceae bacterium]|nr:FecR domain-containing protein [Pyrinomonadaceae bacterium]
MVSKHVNEELSAYCNGELTASESQQVAEHLIGCTQCRADFEQIKLGVKLAGQIPQLAAPASLWTNIEAQLDAQLDAPPKASEQFSRKDGQTRSSWRPWFAAVAAGLILAIGIGAFLIYTRESRPFWEVARLDGAPRVGSSRISDKGQLAVGEWLETDGASRAQIEVASIGHVEVDPNTRVRLVETKPTEHRLELARGRMSAKIWAPPRLFFVNTPSGVAADLGCAYTLEVDDRGASLLKVTSGWVALQLREIESIVPAGASCATRPGIGPGTPYFEDASETLKAALAKLDFDELTEDQRAAVLNQVIAGSRPRDTLTLWHLMYRVHGPQRERVFERMALLAPPPKEVTRDGCLRLDEKMLHLWKGYLENSWSGNSGFKKASVKGSKPWTLGGQ